MIRKMEIDNMIVSITDKSADIKFVSFRMYQCCSIVMYGPCRARLDL